MPPASTPQVADGSHHLITAYVAAFKKFKLQGKSDVEADKLAAELLPEGKIKMKRRFVPYGCLLMMHGWMIHAGAKGNPNSGGLRLHCYTQLAGEVVDGKHTHATSYIVEWEGRVCATPQLMAKFVVEE